MTTLTITLDDHTSKSLRELSEQEGREQADIAARLLRRAVRAARPRPEYDVEAIKAAYAEFALEDEELAESDSAEAAELLAQEDAA